MGFVGAKAMRKSGGEGGDSMERWSIVKGFGLTHDGEGTNPRKGTLRCRLGNLRRRLGEKVRQSLPGMVWNCRHELRGYSGQGTTEYAILVGVLVVIAILAITVFRPKIQELWDAISSGINSL